MPPITGKDVAVKLNGTAIAVTNEAMTALVAGDRYQVTNTARRIWDPGVAVVIKDNGVTVDASLYTFDALYGIVDFSGHVAVGPVTVDGSYLPVHTVAESRAANIGCRRAELDSTIFGLADKTFAYGQKYAEGDVETLDMLDTDLDGGAGTLKVSDLFENGTPALLEVTLGSRFFRAWIVFPGIENASKHDELATGKISWRTSTRTSGSVLAGCGFGS